MDVTAVAWLTSSYSGGACIEVGMTGPAIAVRDSTHRGGLRLSFAVKAWQTFVNQLKASV